MATAELKDHWVSVMGESLWQRLLALPYGIDLDDEGYIVMTPLDGVGLTFDQLADTHPILPDDLPWKVETNAENQLLMSPPPRNDHFEYESDIVALLAKLMPGGKAMAGCGVQTSNGGRIPDAVWISAERKRSQRGKVSYSVAPEICIEVLSPSNRRREIEEKTHLNLEAGALEVWTCGRDGTMKFFNKDGSLPASKLCPAFPARINILD